MFAGWGLSLSEVRDKCRSLGDVEFAQWAVDVGILSSQPPKCCGLDMHIGAKADELDGCAYRCKVCRAYVSIRRSSWCHGAHVKVRELALALACWISERPVDTLVEECGMSKPTALSYYARFRKAAEALYYNDLSGSPLGGPQSLCQIDESAFGRAKYNVGKALARPTYWVFGAIDCATRRVMMEHVEARDAETLLPIIESVIEPASVIHSDCWKAYSGLAAMGYEHDTVNHRENFVSPTGANTQMIEATWGACKRWLRARNARTRSTIMQHVHEWCFRRNMGASFAEAWASINQQLNLP